MFHKQSKHIAIKYHFVREHVDPDGEERTAVLVHVRTGDQTADMLSKALCGLTFEKHRSRNLGEEPKLSSAVAKENRKDKRRRK